MAVAIQIGSVAERIVGRVETLIDARLHRADETVSADTQRCPHCDAIVPAIRPVPFEYCPYCRTALDTVAGSDHESRGPLTRLFEALIPDPVSGSLEPV